MTPLQATCLETELRQKHSDIRKKNNWVPIKEFHAKSILDRSGDWSFIETREQAFEMIEDLLQIIAGQLENSWSSLASRKLLISRYRNAHKVRLVSLRHLAQGVEEKAQKQDFNYVIIADHHEDHRDDVKSFKDYKANGTPGAYRQTKFSRMVDLPLFRDSEDSYLIQAADIVAYVYQKQENFRGSSDEFDFKFKEIWARFCISVPHERLATFV